MISHLARMKLLRALILGNLVGVVVYVGHTYTQVIRSTGRDSSQITTYSESNGAYIVFNKLYSNLYRYVSSHVQIGAPLVETDMFGDLETVRLNYLGDNEGGRVLSPFQEDYFGALKLVPSVHTVYLNIKQSHLNDFLPDRFYSPHSNDCLMLTAGALNHDEGKIECMDLNNYTYRSLKDNMAGSEGMLHIDYRLGLFKPFNNGYDPLVMGDNASSPTAIAGTGEDEIVTPWYVHVIKDAIINMRGEIYTSDKKWKIIGLLKDPTSLHFHYPHRMHPDTHNEVFVLTQYAQEDFKYNWVIECLPRIIRFLSFLLKHPNILIHVPNKSDLVIELLRDLGIGRDRLVSGNMQAKISYLPMGTHYGRGSVVNTNLLSGYIRAMESSSVQQDTIVFLLSQKSFRKPWLRHQNELIALLGTVVKEYNLRLELLPDDTTISVRVNKLSSDDTISSVQARKAIFERAALVVGPHSEGLSNIVFSQPGTCVIETLCFKKWERRYGLRYMHLAHLLGHVYHGLLRPFECSMKMDPGLIVQHVRQCLKFRQQAKNMG